MSMPNGEAHTSNVLAHEWVTLEQVQGIQWCRVQVQCSEPHIVGDFGTPFCLISNLGIRFNLHIL